MPRLDPPKASQFKPGQSGNPKGRVQGIPNAKTRYQRLLNLNEKVKNPITGEIEDFTLAEVLDMKQFERARKGDLGSYKEIQDRLEGKAPQAVDVTSAGEQITFGNNVPRPKE